MRTYLLAPERNVGRMACLMVSVAARSSAGTHLLRRHVSAGDAGRLNAAAPGEASGSLHYPRQK